MLATFPGSAGSAISPRSTGRPGGYLAGAEEAMTVPLPPTATTTAIPWPGWLSTVPTGTPRGYSWASCCA